MDNLTSLVSLLLRRKPSRAKRSEVEHTELVQPQQRAIAIPLEELISGEIDLAQVSEQRMPPVYVKSGYLLRVVPYREKEQLVMEANTKNPIDPEIKSRIESLLREAKSVANGNPTVNGVVSVHAKIMEARQLFDMGKVYNDGRGDFFYDPRFADDVRASVNVTTTKSFGRAKALAKVGSFDEMQRQVSAALVMGYAFGSGPHILTDYHEPLEDVFKEAGVTAKRLARLNLQEGNYTGQALGPVHQVVEMAKTYGVSLSIQFR